MPLSIFRIRLVAAANLGRLPPRRRHVRDVPPADPLHAAGPAPVGAPDGSRVPGHGRHGRCDGRARAGADDALRREAGARHRHGAPRRRLPLVHADQRRRHATSMDLFPGFVAVGIGIPFAFIPVTIAALAGVTHEKAGLASGPDQHVAAGRRRDRDGRALDRRLHARQDARRAGRTPPDVATTGGFQWGFWVAAGIWAAGLLASLVFVRREEVAQPGAVELRSQT